MWQPPSNSSSEQESAPAATVAREEFSSEERAALLRVAHGSIEAAVEGKRFVAERLTGHLAQPRGVFTTIYHHGQLRGCVGYILAVAPLYVAVGETARAAALEDTRFRPVLPEEARELAVSLSVLSTPEEVDPSKVQVGKHGLLVSHQGRRGLLLPQVAVEHGWDRETFLAQTCYKAGLEPDAWQRGARVEAFTAEVFSDFEIGQ
jgi:AmmeMemoRadiSam system protein A